LELVLKNLKITNKNELIKLKEDFSKEYKKFFNQDLKNSKVEQFLAQLYGAKNFNTLMGSFENSENIEFKSFEEFQLFIEDQENPYSKRKLALVEYFPSPYIEIEVTENYDKSGNFNTNRIHYIDGDAIADCEEISKLKAFLKNLKLSGKESELSIIYARLMDLDTDYTAQAIFQGYAGADYLEWEECMNSIINTFNFYREIFSGDLFGALMFSMDFLLFCNDGMISDSVVTLLDNTFTHVDINRSFS
jgi:hypothetical protein